MITKKFLIIAESGMHSRPATILVTEADKYSSKITLSVHNNDIDFKSIIGVLSLGIYMGEEISLIFDGADEQEACQRISTLILELKLGKEVE